MSGLQFSATVTDVNARKRGTLVDFPDVWAEGATTNDVHAALLPLLKDAVLNYVDETNVLPTPMPITRDPYHLVLDLPPLDIPEKAMEKLLDFSKAEFDRVLGSTKLAEERAKQNGTYALAVSGLLAFFKPAAPTAMDLWLIYLTMALTLLELVLVGFTLLGVTVKGVGLTAQEMREEREVIFSGYRPYTSLLWVLQGAWIKGTEAMRVVRDRRFSLVTAQHVVLIVIVSLLFLQVIFAVQRNIK